MRVQPDANSVVTIYLTSGGDSPADAANMAVYQGEYGLRAASSSMISTAINGSNAYATFPSNNNIYANANCYAEVEIFNVRSGGVSGVTNVQAARTRGFRFFSFWSYESKRYPILFKKGKASRELYEDATISGSRFKSYYYKICRSAT